MGKDSKTDWNTREDSKYLYLLSKSFKNIKETCTEIIHQSAMLYMPKGTEHFVSDIHGEYDSFNHVLKNASGVIKNYIHELFGNTLMDNEKRNLATLIYYPEQKLEVVKKDKAICDIMQDWYRVNLFRLMHICKRVSSKYTRQHVRKALPEQYMIILDELIHENVDSLHKSAYYNEIIDQIIRLETADDFICAIAHVIQQLSIETLHVIGDIYDRGTGADKIMDVLEDYHSVDVQWGNHDISWMGAASGSLPCICTVIRICAKYNTMRTLEEGYGVNLLPLAAFAMKNYKSTALSRFYPEKIDVKMTDNENELIAMMHKAITILGFKAEANVIQNHPEYEMDDRLLLNKINFQNKTIQIDDKHYPLLDCDFPTVSEKTPFAFTEDELELAEKLCSTFVNCQKLRQHVRFLFNKGSMYKVINGNVLFHGCIPLAPDGNFKPVTLFGTQYKGRRLLDKMDETVRKGFFEKDNSPEKQQGLDLMWYLWCGADSPLYGKNKMTTFERYFIDDKSLWIETKDPYYSLRNDENVCFSILEEFGLLSKNRGKDCEHFGDMYMPRIVNGHVPVLVSSGENPIKANGLLIVIDGGFTKAYQHVTGIAGYTLIANSQGLLLASHEPFVSSKEAVENEADIVSSTVYIEKFAKRKKVEDTDKGLDMKASIADLERLLSAYRSGQIKENE